MVLLTEDTEKEDKVNEYIEYLDRSRRTNGKRRIDIHETKISKEYARYCKLTEDEIDQLTERFKNETDVFLLPSEIVSEKEKENGK